MITRFLGTLLGLTAHLLLVVTIWYLFPFLMGGRVPDGLQASRSWWWDGLLILQFGLSHSVMLLPPVRHRLERYFPAALYGCLFTVVTSLSLLILILAWQLYPLALWQLSGNAERLMQGAYVLSWVALVYSLYISGIGYQTGWTTFWPWLRGRPAPHRHFEIRGAYRLIRHPVYLSFLCQIWLTPVLTLDRALLCVLFSIYLMIGSYLKDRRLVYYLGDVYRRYQAQVPGYPLIWGPLGRVSPPAPQAQPALQP
jgi:protein-S-isoprenylcysteine O-methyltransferase Ste14